jgi:hypothetical protein
VGDLLTTCFGPKGPSSGIKVTKKSYWVVSGLYVNGISFVQLIGLYRMVIGVCVCVCVFVGMLFVVLILWKMDDRIFYYFNRCRRGDYW